MKKVLMALAVMAIVGAVQADLVSRTWSSQYVYTGLLAAPGTSPSGSGVDGYGWQTDVATAGSDASLPSLLPNVATAVSYGWYDGGGYYVGGFQFDALEGDAVVLRLWNTDGGVANAPGSWYIDSQVLALPDLVDPIPLGSTDVQFDFSGSNWQQVVPEPATIGLMGVAGVGLFLARRKTRR